MRQLDRSSSTVVRPRYPSPCAYTLYEAGVSGDPAVAKQAAVFPSFEGSAVISVNKNHQLGDQDIYFRVRVLDQRN